MEDWYKTVLGLPRKPAVYRLARALRCNMMEARGIVGMWLDFLNTYTENGSTEMLPAEVDSALEWQGATDGLIAIGWAALDGAGCVFAVDFGRHNGSTAKSRAQAAVRMQRMRYGASVTKALTEGEGEFIGNTEGVGRATAIGASSAEPAPTPMNGDAFSRWLDKLCAAHPSARRNRRVNGEVLLQADVDSAARAAFERCPQAVESAELLAAYYADTRLKEDRYGVKFYRPTGQRKFFDDLEDVLTKAERWAKDAKWRPQEGGQTPPRRKAQEPKTQGAADDFDPMQEWKKLNEGDKE